MLLKLILEILVLWVWFALFMAWIVKGKGPLGGIFYYDKQVQQRVMELGLIDQKTLQKWRTAANSTLVVGDVVILFIMIVLVNGARSFWDCAWQFYVLFIGMELFDLAAVDILWVAKTKWWDIPGTEDLQQLWHDPTKKIKGKARLLIVTIPLAAIFGGLYCLIAGLI